ncbi:MAG: hypothetical protein H6861_06745 [Rhodospirillales bacterium]|nr:hypothetical protein [Rhodospirillales bacterium]
MEFLKETIKNKFIAPSLIYGSFLMLFSLFHITTFSKELYITLFPAIGIGLLLLVGLAVVYILFAVLNLVFLEWKNAAMAITAAIFIIVQLVLIFLIDTPLFFAT